MKITGILLVIFMLWALTACNPEPTAVTIAATEIMTIATKTTVPTLVPTTDPPTETPMMPTANADVLFVKATQSADGTWHFDVTVAHPDTGWEDYADGWDVVLPDGSVVKVNPTDPFTRLLAHPHETEQPFTRSQGGIRIPDGVTTVTVRAHDLVDGWGGKTVIIDLTQSIGDGFEVQK